MRFLDSSQLYWALTAVVPLVLFLLRRKPRRVPVSSLLFFKALGKEHRESAWLRFLKRLLALLLTLLVIAGAVGALAHLVVSPPAGQLRSVIVVVDRSASMAAKDAGGHSRLDEALQAIRTRLAGLPGGVAVMLIAFDRQAEVITPKTFDRRTLARALENLRVRPLEGDAESALRLGAQLAALETPTAIWFASDSPAPASASTAQLKVESLNVPLAAPRNVGVTGFAIRALPLESGHCEAFVQIQAVGPDVCETKVEVRIDGILTAVRSLSLAPGSRESLLLPIAANAGKLLSVAAITAGDQLPGDDEVQARIPAPHILKVLWISPEPDPYTQLALTALSRDGELVVFRAGPEAWPPKEAVDTVIFQNWLPKLWTDNLPAIVINPPAALGPVQAAHMDGPGLPVDHLRAPRPRHPLLYGVATGRLALTQTAVLATEGALEPLWTGPAGPLLAAGESGGQRVAVFGFAPERSENLPLSASYPLLLGNAIRWSAKTESSATSVQRPGDFLPLRGQTLSWIKNDGSKMPPLALKNGWVSLDQIGLWQSDGGDSGSTALLSSKETMLPAGNPSTSSPQIQAKRSLRGDMTGPLLWLVLSVLILESWLFHRHAVH